MNFASGKEAGSTFEKVFERQAQLAGLWADPNHIKAKRAWKGRLQELLSNLDYTLICPDGRVGYFDCKTYDERFFYLSKIQPHQIALALRYNESKVPAGFVVWFRPLNEVCFFPGWLLAHAPPGTRLYPYDGTHLGRWDRFDVMRLFSLSAKGSESGS